MDINLNIKIKKNITSKLFIITSLVLLAFLIFSLAFQSMFFGDFYLKRKTNNLQNDVTKFKLNYSYNITDNYKLYESMQNFETMNNAKIAILSNVGEIVYLPNPENHLDDTVKSKLNYILKNLIYSGTFSDVLNGKKETVTTLINDNNLDSKNIVCISAISLKEKNDGIIIAYSPFQPIEEASSIIKSFYIYLALFALVVIIVLSIIYTNIISKPLVKINQVALKLSRLDFSETCPIESEDEIGNLAKTLNFLSLNLNNALKDLNSANENLKKDIENEKKLETLRKDFVANVSHELKTPIALIEGYAEGIKDGIVSDNEIDEYLDVIIDESQKMNALVMDMLKLNKLESPNFKLNYTDFSILTLINKCCKNLEHFVAKKNLNINYPTEDFSVVGDEFRINEVITNLLTNAIEHSNDNSSIDIIIEDLNHKIKINIINYGNPIPKEEMKNIWDKFYKIDKSRNRILGGTGLGLAIVKNILVAHKSKFGVETMLNKVCFFFTLDKDNQIKQIV